MARPRVAPKVFVSEVWPTTAANLASSRGLALALLFLSCSFVEFLDVFGRGLVEVLQAVLATKFDLAAFVREDVRVAHLTKFLARDDAGLERVWFGLGVRLLVSGERTRPSQKGKRQEPGRQVFHFFHKHYFAIDYTLTATRSLKLFRWYTRFSGERNGLPVTPLRA